MVVTREASELDVLVGWLGTDCAKRYGTAMKLI
jgi:hypothetical protein